jgi:iron complex transport system substrate-binding protein
MLSDKLSELNIPYIYIGDYLENDPLGKAEWVVALGYICGCEKRGQEIFKGIEERYLATRESAQGTTNRPRVMLNTPYRDSWFMPAVESYAVQLIADAGAEYIYSQNKSHQSTPISLEQALLLASAADVWINVGNIASLAQLKSENPRFATIPAVTSGRVYNNTKRTNNAGGSDFWESGALNADIVLDDMIKLLHHNAPTDSLHYYKRLE